MYLDSPGSSSLEKFWGENIYSNAKSHLHFEQVAKHGHASQMDFTASVQKPEGMASFFKPRIWNTQTPCNYSVKSSAEAQLQMLSGQTQLLILLRLRNWKPWSLEGTEGSLPPASLHTGRLFATSLKLPLETVSLVRPEKAAFETFRNFTTLPWAILQTFKPNFRQLRVDRKHWFQSLLR